MNQFDGQVSRQRKNKYRDGRTGTRRWQGGDQNGINTDERSHNLSQNSNKSTSLHTHTKDTNSTQSSPSEPYRVKRWSRSSSKSLKSQDLIPESRTPGSRSDLAKFLSKSDLELGLAKKPDLKALSSEEKLQQRAARFGKAKKPQYGFVSRGEDNTLQKDESSRKSLFKNIVDSFVVYCGQNSASRLHQQLEKFVNRNELVVDQLPPEKPIEIDTIVSSLRKLREAMINRPIDDFGKEVFLFSVRLGAAIGHYQTYIPSIDYLLRPGNKSRLSRLEQREVASLLVVHVCHFNKEYGKCMRIFFQHLDRVEDCKIYNIVQSYYLEDYHTWTSFYNKENDGTIFTIMTFGLLGILQSMVECMSKSYFNISLSELEKMLPQGTTFESIQDYASWRLDEGSVVIRERRR